MENSVQSLQKKSDQLAGSKNVDIGKTLADPKTGDAVKAIAHEMNNEGSKPGIGKADWKDVEEAGERAKL